MTEILSTYQTIEMKKKGKILKNTKYIKLQLICFQLYLVHKISLKIR